MVASLSLGLQLFGDLWVYSHVQSMAFRGRFQRFGLAALIAWAVAQNPSTRKLPTLPALRASTQNYMPLKI